MNKKNLTIFAVLMLVGSIAWHAGVPRLLGVLSGGMDLLPKYFLSKGLFVAVMVALMVKYGGLKFYGFERGKSWWFLVPALPFLVLTILVLINPESPYGLGLQATLGWTMVAAFVGIGEEGIFRGVLWRAMEERGILITSLVTSLLFGSVHLTGLLGDIPWQVITAQAVFAFGVGMMFAAVRLVSGSLIAPIVMHAVFDAGAIVAAGGVKEMFDSSMDPMRLVVSGGVFFLWGLVAVLIIRHRRLKAA